MKTHYFNGSLLVLNSFKKRLYIATLCMFFLQILQVDSQTVSIPPSPNASSLGKYGEYPVGTYTGTPQISLPIGEAKGKLMSVPVSISYHASGIKVDEIASQVGLGWSLNAGGVITRTIKGLPDESTYGFANYNFDTTKNADLSSALFKLMDTEPDVFFFNMNGYSGKFYLDRVNNLKVVRLVPYQDIDIKFIEEATGNRWVMTTPDGTKYYFSTPEYNNTLLEDLSFRTDVTSWYLTKIEDLTGELATFSYQQGDQLSYRPAINETLLTPSLTNNSACFQQVTAEFNPFTNPVQVTTNKVIALGQWSFNSSSVTTGNSGLQVNSPVVQTNPLYINEIVTYHNKVKFNYVSNRQDLALGALALQSVTISNKNDYTANTFIPVKKVNFSYDYFSATDATLTPFNDDRNLVRLKLTKLTEIGIALDLTETALPSYDFEYYEDANTNLPARLSPKQDHWGYANSNPANTLIPRNLADPSLYNKGDRSTDIVRCVAGTIKKIKYPTGGYTEFEFEPHTTINSPELIALSTPQFTFSSETIVADFSYENSPNTQSAFIDVPTNQIVDISYALALGNEGIPDYYGYVRIDKVDANGNVLSNIFTAGDPNAGVPSTNNSQNPTGMLSTRRYFPVGRYKLTAHAQTQQVSLPERSTITVGYYKIAPGQTAQPATAIIGGVRIKRIKNFENTNSQPIVKRFEYNLFSDVGNSSGKLISLPKYNYDLTLAIICNMPTGINPHNVPYECGECLINGIVSSSKVPLGSSQGSHIVYSNVSIFNGENGEGGKSAITYSYRADDTNYNIPFAQHDSYEWMRGNVEQQIDYKKVGLNYVELKKVTNTYLYSDYSNNGANNRLNSYVRTGYIVALKLPNRVTEWSDTKLMTKINSYKIYAPWVSLQSTTTVQDGVITTTNYDYETHGYHSQPVIVHTWDSKGLELKTETVYTKNTLTSTDAAIQACINMNILAPLEQRITYNTVFQGGVKNKYELKTVNTKSIPLQTQWIKILRDNTEIIGGTADYNTEGFISNIVQKGFTIPKTYTWVNGLVKTQSFGGLTTSVDYKAGSTVVEGITDENGLMKKFSYDALFRLTTVQDRFQTDANNNPIGSTVQATTTYNYHYKGQPVSLPNDVNDVNQNFVSTKTTFINATNTTPLCTKQYLDGLGRPIEVVKEYYTPTSTSHPNDFWHQKNMVAYDVLGRQNKAYLPIENGTLGYQAPSVFAAANPFVLTEYEASPLSRPIKQTNVDGSTVQTSYGSNATSEVRLFSVPTEGQVSSSSYYPVNFLYKTVMTDENNKSTCVFKDKLGRVVLTRKLLNNKRVDTYNVYDDYGQLTAVLPPGSVDSASGAVTYSLAFLYKYDKQNRLIEKKVPGAEAQKFFYDKRDLLTLTQDGNMAHESPAKYLATQYDDLGRVLRTGWKFDTTGLWSGAITIADDDNKLTQTEYYPNKSWVKHQGAKVLKPTTVTTNRNFVWSYIERRDGITYTGNPVWTGKQHLLNANQPERQILDADTEGVDWTVSAYDGAQKPYISLRYLFTGGVGSEVRTYQTYAYDNGQRLKDTKYMYALNGAGLEVPTFTLSNLNYNFKDQLIEKNIGYNGSTALQSIDYSYNLRGWLAYINGLNVYGNNNPIYTPSSIGASPIQNLMISPLVRQAMLDMAAPYKSSQAMELPPINDNNVDLFSEKIDYNSPDSRTGAPSQLNGNISAVTWQVAGRDKQAYGFKYDDLDRLTDATYFDLTDVNTNGQWNSTYSTDNKFWEKATYDVRGNITALKRNGYKWGAWTTNGYTAANYSLIDDLAYTYNSQNQVTYIHDAAPNPSLPPNVYGGNTKGFVENNQVNMMGGDHYEYDYNGNMKADKHKGMTIEYNYLNLPQVITFSGNRTITFVYDASGAKLQKITNDNGAKITYNYVNGVEYKEDVLQRLAHTEGAVVRNDFGAYDQEYVLRDHLGNVRVMFKDGTNKGDAYYTDYWQYIDPNAGNTGYNDGVITQDDIKTINNYYPFGMDMEGNWNGSFDVANNKYKYNEKEWNDDFGLGLYDYGARFYDPAVARWTSVDPMSDKMTRYSPYNYCFNNPMRFIDPDGMIPGGPGDPIKRDNRIKQEVRAIMQRELKRGNINIDEIKAQNMVAETFYKAAWYRGGSTNSDGQAKLASKRSSGQRVETRLDVEVYGKAVVSKNLLENKNEGNLAYNTAFTVNIADKLKDGTLRGGTLNISLDHKGYAENVMIKYQTKDGVQTLQSSLTNDNRFFNASIDVSQLTSNSVEFTVVGTNTVPSSSGGEGLGLPNSYDLQVSMEGNIIGEFKNSRVTERVVKTTTIDGNR